MNSRPVWIGLSLALFNATTAVLYASLPLLLGPAGWQTELARLVGPRSGWTEAQGVLVGAGLGAAILTPGLVNRIDRMILTDSPMRTRAVVLSGVLRGYAVVFISSMLGPGIWGWASGDVGLSPGGFLGVLGAAPFGLLMAPLFAAVTTPIVVAGGALNALVCVALLTGFPRTEVLSNNELQRTRPAQAMEPRR